VLRLN